MYHDDDLPDEPTIRDRVITCVMALLDDELNENQLSRTLIVAERYAFDPLEE